MKSGLYNALVGFGMCLSLSIRSVQSRNGVADQNIASAAHAVSSQCHSNACFEMSIPDATSKSGSGDVFYQISGPTSYGWIAMGTGSQMKGSNMIIIYTNSNGNNVTVSPRTSSGETLPTFDSSKQITLLAGSGVSNGKMTANIKCKYLPLQISFLTSGRFQL
jgi:Cytochrome domain of cellobiose dehydrogenase